MRTDNARPIRLKGDRRPDWLVDEFHVEAANADG